jgi:hypothetical protein
MALTPPEFDASQFGDRIRTPPNTILTLDVWQRLLREIYNYRQGYIGAELGPCEGVLGAQPTTFHVSEPEKHIRFGQMVLVAAKNADAGSLRPYGGIYHFVPTDPHQLQTWVNVAAYEGSQGVIWWSPWLVPSDYGQFLQWKPGWPKGKVVAGNRLERTRVHLAATSSWSSPPGDGGPWFKLASFTFPSEGEPIVTFVHAFDRGVHLGNYSSAANRLGQFMMAQTGDTDPAPSFSTSRALSLLAHFICATNSNTHQFNTVTGQITAPSSAALYMDPSIRGRLELHNELGAAELAIGNLETQLAAANVRITALENSPRGALYAAVVQDDATIFTQQGSILGEGAVTVTPAGTGTYQIDFPRPVDVSPGSRAIPQVTINGTVLGHVQASWVSDTQLIVQTYDTVPYPAARAFVVSVFGR